MRTHALAALGLLAAAIPACSSAPDAEPTGATEERSIAAINARWPSPTIAVCWLPTTIGDSKLAAKKQSIQTAVNDAFAPAGVTFTGWGDCPASIAGFDGIAITITNDGNPNSQIGREQPTQMLLNFTMQNAGSTAARGHCNYPANLGACLQMAAVHEFGHALGLEHEETRSDDAQNCGVVGTRRFDDFNVDLGALDPGSIMNHCNPGLYGLPSFQTTLSPGDVAGVSFLFGRASAPSPITLSFGSALFPWYFLNADASGNLQMTAIDGPLPATALFTVVPALNGDPAMVSLQSGGLYACNHDAGMPVQLLASCDPSLASWTIDFATNVAPGDSGLRFTLPNGRKMNIGPSPANQVYTAPPSQVPNPMEMDFVPRTQVTERLLRNGREDATQINFLEGTYLTHQNGEIVLDVLASPRLDDGNWELVAGLDDPQLVSIRYTDGQGNRFFVQESAATAILAPAATVVASRATFRRTRVAATNVDFGRYRFVEELGGNLELCQKNALITMCAVGSVTDDDSTFWQMLPFPDPFPGVSNGNDACGAAAQACAAYDQPSYQALAATCTQLGGVAPPCSLPACQPGYHFCPPRSRNGTCFPGVCTPTGFCMMGAACTYSSTL